MDQVGIQDNFFELGGNSLIGVEIVADVRTRAGAGPPAAARALPGADGGCAGDARPRRPTAEHASDTSRAAGAAAAGSDRAAHADTLRSRRTQHDDTDYDSAVAHHRHVRPVPRRRERRRAVAQPAGRACRACAQFTDEELTAAGVEPGAAGRPALRPGRRLRRRRRPVRRRRSSASARARPRRMDPQHRLFLECCLGGARRAPATARPARPGQVGVFAGCGFPDYIVHNIAANLAERGPAARCCMADRQRARTRWPRWSPTSWTCAARASPCRPSARPRWSRCTWPARACSPTSATWRWPAASYIAAAAAAGYLYEQGGIISPDGMCRSLRRRGQRHRDGQRRGVVVLKRMAEALADGDLIHAVILGSAVNNDGRGRAGYTAPGRGRSGRGHRAEALGVAGVKPEPSATSSATPPAPCSATRSSWPR